MPYIERSSTMNSNNSQRGSAIIELIVILPILLGLIAMAYNINILLTKKWKQIDEQRNVQIKRIKTR